MYLQKTYDWWQASGRHLEPNSPDHMGYDVGYHATVQQYEGQEQYKRDDCEWLDGKPCYGDGSAMRAEEWMNIFLEKGDEEIWKMLEQDYKERFSTQR